MSKLLAQKNSLYLQLEKKIIPLKNAQVHQKYKKNVKILSAAKFQIHPSRSH